MAENTEEVNGSTVLAKALKDQGVQYVFGIVGFPVIELGVAFQNEGIKFVAMRNEQSASYAAQAIGYMDQRPAVVLTVSGPGLVHAFAGMANANENGWPMIVISGSSETALEGMQAFQEYPQVDLAKQFAKYSARPSSVERIPFYVEKAVRMSLYGRPGATYIDMPADMINRNVSSDKVRYTYSCPAPPRPLAEPGAIKSIINILMYEAKRPLVIIGKGAAYSRAEDSIRKFVVTRGLPFLPTPMGKGVVPDDHEYCVASARSRALLQADVIILLGARLNWILHFGHSPRFDPKVKIIQVDIHPEELHSNVKAAVAIQGDIDAVVTQLNEEFAKVPGEFEFNTQGEWWRSLRQKCTDNQRATEAQIAESSPPMNYYNAFYEIERLLPKDCLFVNEGSNTMDIGRTMFPNYHPRHRLDAGTFGTMGIGLGFAVAAAVWCRVNAPQKRVVCVLGDSAFGFSGMEVETVCRYNLPITFIVINNNGIMMGVDSATFDAIKQGDQLTQLPPVFLSPDARYDKMMEAFGGRGYFVDNREELSQRLQECLKYRGPSLINVKISPHAGKKSQEFFWLTSKM